MNEYCIFFSSSFQVVSFKVIKNYSNHLYICSTIGTCPCFLFFFFPYSICRRKCDSVISSNATESNIKNPKECEWSQNKFFLTVESVE